jgi:hypothetical protein
VIKAMGKDTKAGRRRECTKASKWTLEEAEHLHDSIWEKLTVPTPDYHLAEGGATVPVGKSAKGHDKNRDAAVTAYLTAFVSELQAEHLINSQQKSDLIRSVGCTDLGEEAMRRLKHFAQSLCDDKLEKTRGAFRTPGLTVLVPSFNESIVNELPLFEKDAAQAERDLDAACESRRRTLGFKPLCVLLFLSGLMLGGVIVITFEFALDRLAEDLSRTALILFAGFLVVFISTFLLLKCLFPKSKAPSDDLEAELRKCGAEVTLHKAKWKRCKDNLNDVELVQAAQLKLQQLIEARDRKPVGQAAQWLEVSCAAVFHLTPMPLRITNAQRSCAFVNSCRRTSCRRTERSG